MLPVRYYWPLALTVVPEFGRPTAGWRVAPSFHGKKRKYSGASFYFGNGPMHKLRRTAVDEPLIRPGGNISFARECSAISSRDLAE